MRRDPRPLVAHLLYRFDTGGLENGVVNLINHLPADRFRHAVIALTEITGFNRRIERDDVEFVALKKPPGQGLWMFPRVRRLFAELRPDIVHTRNLGALEMAMPAAWARVPVRIHGEHGWDIADPDGRNRKHRLVRRLYRPFVHHYIALSSELERYLVHTVGVAPARVAKIYNGVDTRRFHPAEGGREPIDGSPFGDGAHWIVGTVGRLSAIKDQVTLARAFVRALDLDSEARRCMRLVIAGEGGLRPQVQAVLDAAGVQDSAWLAGDRSDIPALMRGLDAFVLPSLAEGISNTILEAMSSGLPVIATSVGGNVELLEDGATGRLLPPADPASMADAILESFRDPGGARRRSQRARAEVERRFSLASMIQRYSELYEHQLEEAVARGALDHRLT